LSEVSGLNGKRALLIEDETLVAMLIEDMLADVGCEIAGVAARLSDAMAMAGDETLKVDLAILDVNLAGESSFAVADILERRGVPFVFSTGYGPNGLPDAWKGRPVLQKPFTAAEVQTVLERVVAGG
jgi:CheY-like chemotaxis protein